jgi:tetratricopeptide (TPR) repeat protein
MSLPTTSQEPTPEFNTHCIDLLTQWDTGKITARELLNKLDGLMKEIAPTAHAANLGRVEHLLGYVYHYLGNYATSIQHYEKARRYYVRAENRRRIATIDLNQGENYRLKGEYSRALALYRSSYETAQEMGHLPLMSYALTNEAHVLTVVKNFEYARKSFEQAYTLTDEWHGKVYEDNVEDSSLLRAEILLGLAELEIASKNYEAAWNYSNRALEYARYLEELRGQGLAYRVMGDILTVFNPNPTQEPNCDEMYRLATNNFRTINAEGEIARTLFAYAKSLAHRGQRNKAAQLFRESMVIFTRLGMSQEAVKAAEAQLKVL